MKRNYMPLLAAGGVGIAVGAFVTGSAAGVLPLLLVLACPIMMMFMMGSMGGMHHGGGDRGKADDAGWDGDRHERLDEPHRPEQRR